MKTAFVTFYTKDDESSVKLESALLDLKCHSENEESSELYEVFLV